MTVQEAIWILKATAECIHKHQSGDYNCEHVKCDQCVLHYDQGTIDKKIQAIEIVVEVLKEQLSKSSEIPNSSDDLISRQAAIDAVEESRRLNHHQDEKEACAHEYEHRHFLKILIDLPSAEPKKGKWIYKNDLKQFFCSECGFPSLTYDDRYIYSMDLPNYCEDCGADMRGEET